MMRESRMEIEIERDSNSDSGDEMGRDPGSLIRMMKRGLNKGTKRD